MCMYTCEVCFEDATHCSCYMRNVEIEDEGDEYKDLMLSKFDDIYIFVNALEVAIFPYFEKDDELKVKAVNLFDRLKDKIKVLEQEIEEY